MPRRSARLAGAVIAMGAWLVAVGPAAADETLTWELSVVDCASPTPAQLCPPISAIEVRTDGVLKVDFTASAGHCSSIIAHVFLDGVERAVSEPLTAGASTGAIDLGPVVAGSHTVGIQAEGVVGGCNSGALSNWTGTMLLTVSGTPGPQGTPFAASPAPAAPTGAASAPPAGASPTAPPAFATEAPQLPADGPAGAVMLVVIVGLPLLAVLLWFLLARRRRREEDRPGRPPAR